METDSGLKMNYTEIHRDDAESHGEPDLRFSAFLNGLLMGRCSTH